MEIPPVDVLVGMKAVQFASSQVRCLYDRAKLVTASMLSPAIKNRVSNRIIFPHMDVKMAFSFAFMPTSHYVC